uniref:Pleckstrin homology domain containing, family G (with RhoGef domain) member 2 n=1 Tax=Hippocampus comes TaxID=109280 RepID=A0A3Q2ZPA7_HIPCM
MPEGSRRGSSRSSSNAGARRPSSVSSLSGIVGRLMSPGERGASSSSCTSVNTVCSDGERPASLSLSSSASSASLQDASSSSSSSSLPYGAVPAYDAAAAASSSRPPESDRSDISLDLTPLAAGGGAAKGGRPADPAPRQLSRLERVVMEIVETERAYVRDLKSIVEDYLGCIIECDALAVDPEQVSALFCNVEDIYEFNSELLEDLERSQHAAAIADCFVERSEAFDIYTLYCMNYPNSVSVLRECMKNQRLVPATDGHPPKLVSDDGAEVGKAVRRGSDCSRAAASRFGPSDNWAPPQEIESLLVNWSGPDLSGFGELVLEGSFKVHRVKKERAFFLFDKMLLIAKKRLERFVYSTHIFCCNLLLVDALKEPLCFRVSDLMIPKQQHVVQTKNMEEKRLWVHYLKKLIVENHPATLPHKARQVLGDNICQSPQFEHDHLKKFSSASPRPDDVHAYRRGRRQSEPPQLLTYTPEKSRKSLPLLLEGSLPYRRTRRQSAKDGNKSPLFTRTDDDEVFVNLPSSGIQSSQVEEKTERGSGNFSNEQSQQEPNEGDFAALCAPPTLSITEEILELINQSRAREALVSPVSRPSVEEQTASPQIGLERAHVVHEKGQNASRPGKPLILPTPPSAPTDFPSSNSVTEDRQASRTFYEEEAADPSTNPDDSHRASPSDKPKRGSALTQRDKRIIEKIRSYYEAAAELVEDEETSERRNSSSQVPTETVKDSVSRFTSDHQDEGRKEAVETEPDHDVALPSPAGPASPLLPEDSHNHDGHADMPTRLMDVEAKDGNKSPLFTRTDDDEVFVNLPSSGIQSSQVEEKTERGSGNFSNEQSQQEPNEGAENSQREATPWQEEGPFTQSNDTSQSVPPELARTKGSEWQLKEPKEEKESLTESSGTLSSTPQCPETTPAWTGSKHKGTKTSRNLEELPSQTQLGRGSRQSRIVSTNRALFEGMVSDITGIGLFEASPVADPSLMENSERILSKVQTLASMYSAKASTMKVPLHQKRAIFIRNKAGDLTGPSSLSSQTQCHSQAKCSQAPAKVAHTPRPTSDEQTDTKNGSQRFSRSKAQSGSLTRTENGSHVPAKAQMLCERQNHGEADGKNQNLTVSRRDIGSLDQRVTPERMGTWSFSSVSQYLPHIAGVGFESRGFFRKPASLSTRSQAIFNSLDRSLKSQTPCGVTACPSPFVVAPLSPPAALADEDLVSPETPSGTRLACFSALPSSGRSFSDRAPPPSSAPHSSACSRALSKGARPSSPRPPSSCRSPPGSPPVASSSTFTRSLAASCISQTLAKKNNGRHQVQSSSTQSPSPTPSFPSSHLPRCSPSPQLSHSQKVTLTPAYSQLGAATDRNPRYPPSPLRPTCPSPSSVQSTFHSNSQNFSPPSSPFIRQSHRQPFSSASAHPHHHSLRHNVAFAQNDSSSICLPTSSNYGLGSGTSSPGPPKVQLVNADTNITAAQHAGDRLSFGSHNRMARPFSASEPNSRVQSPSPAVSPPSITRLRSPPLLQSSSSAMANERPRPRCSGPGGASSHNPLGLTLNIPEASAASLPTGPASSRASPQVLSPPAIGVSVWTCNVTAPRPRNPQFISPSRSATSALPHGSRAGSPQGHALQRSLSSPSDTCQIPAQSEPGDPRDSWSGSSPRCLGFDRQESGLASPRSGWSSCGGSATCLSPRAGLQSPVSPGRFTPRRSDFGGEHFSGEPWLDGQLLCNNCNAHGGFYTSGTSTAIPSTSPLTSLAQSPCSSMAVDWEDPELGQGSCRSQLICAYIGRPPPEANFASSRLVKVPQQKPSYATTVNLQIAGSGRITSFSTAHVSVSQTPPGRPGRGEIHSARRVSINGLSPVPSPLPQNCGQL